jgi:hypothetical protein
VLDGRTGRTYGQYPIAWLRTEPQYSSFFDAGVFTAAMGRCRKSYLTAILVGPVGGNREMGGMSGRATDVQSIVLKNW